MMTGAAGIRVCMSDRQRVFPPGLHNIIMTVLVDYICLYTIYTYILAGVRCVGGPSAALPPTEAEPKAMVI